MVSLLVKDLEHAPLDTKKKATFHNNIHLLRGLVIFILVLHHTAGATFMLFELGVIPQFVDTFTLNTSRLSSKQC